MLVRHDFLLLKGLGFNIVGGTDQQYMSNDSSIYVSRIKKDGAAYLDGRLQEGDKILAVNGRDLKDLRHKDAVELFRNAGCDVSLRIQRRLYLVGGSFGLREFAQIRYDVHKLHGKVDPALKEKLKQNTVTLESEYEKLEKSDLDNWENIRGPRLWEDSRTVQQQRREALRLKKE
ncbi:PREDICTED: synaptojanin-2-binding protein-like [Chaetura pelagica]|uniref:synaptojanin-2-binding protein-like n=1 Tax=Chaetura pelagica TaxID=8897 RepID=UPI000523EB81|nr:PREDICTED: synaptojanin-2-binding protein-like [Chaetura pelagica]